jgi:hypothetical protein
MRDGRGEREGKGGKHSARDWDARDHCQYILDGQIGSELRRKGKWEIGREGDGLTERQLGGSMSCWLSSGGGAGRRDKNDGVYRLNPVARA